MGAGMDTSKWGKHQDIKLNSTAEPSGLVKNIQDGFKFMSKAAD
jgi:hypothetical protein